jgi:hypothetical protein
MGSSGVVPIDELRDVHFGRTDAVIGPQVHPLVLDRAPQSLHKHVVTPGSLAIHGQTAAPLKHGLGEFLGSELAALIGVDDLRRAVTDLTPIFSATGR